jgi:hypothetical protein
MSQKHTTTSNNSTAFQFDPASLNAYHSAINTALPLLQGFAKNPYDNDTYRLESTTGMDNAARLGGRGVSNVMNNAAALGYGTSGGAFNSMLAAAGRHTGSLQAQAARSAMLNASQRQLQSTGMLTAFQPLMTGSDSRGEQNQTSSGLGTWLPQLLGSLGGAALGAFTGGAGAAAGAGTAGSAGAKIANFAGSSLSNAAPMFGGVTGGYPGMSTNMNSLNGLFPPGYNSPPSSPYNFPPGFGGFK